MIDPRTSLCFGCGRTLPEIARWHRMESAERQAVMALLPARMADAGFHLALAIRIAHAAGQRQFKSAPQRDAVDRRGERDLREFVLPGPRPSSFVVTVPIGRQGRQDGRAQ